MKNIFLLATVLFSVVSIAQNISGKAYYESKTTVDMSNWGGREMSEDQKRQIAERMKSMLEKTYILTFSGNESIYKEQEKLETGAGRGFGMMMNSFSAGKQYKNLETNQILEEREFFGKQFLVNDTITNLQWVVGKESKQIGQYLVIKATAMKAVDPNDFSMARRRNRNNDKEKKEGKEVVDSTKVADPFDEIEVPKEILVTAWFTPQIPVKNGPGEYAGLPGLILEMNIDRTTILCSKIVINPKEADKIEAPDKGKEVSREEYNKIIKEKMDEMRENWRGGNGRRGGGRRFGG
ncbi:MAG: GLPGLI family protein [Flavobacteriaceae bacterium]|nr:GLPGLI family protein [Flavobacteriaceae bacterium]